MYKICCVKPINVTGVYELYPTIVWIELIKAGNAALVKGSNIVYELVSKKKIILYTTVTKYVKIDNIIILYKVLPWLNIDI